MSESATLATVVVGIQPSQQWCLSEFWNGKLFFAIFWVNMGGKPSRPLPVIHDAAREVLNRRKNLPPRGVLGLPLKRKPQLNEYNEQLHKDMTKVLNVKTVNVSVSNL